MPEINDPREHLPEPRFSQRWHWGSKQPISFLMQQAVQNPRIISLAAGLVDTQTLPVEPVREACALLLQDARLAREALQYGTTLGAARLRRQLMSHIARQEGCAPAELGIADDQLVMTTGSQQLLSLVGEVLVDPDDIVLVAAPTYFAFLGTLNGLGARVLPVPADADGMDMAELESLLASLERRDELPRVKLIYVVSYYENPSGVSLSASRRQRLVELARTYSRGHKIYVLEDAAYRELRYDGPVLPSVWSFDPRHELVILAQTFSKSLAPGLRVGYGVLPRELVSPVSDRKGNEDFGSANFNQHLVATLFERDLYAPHVTLLQNTYRAKRDRMLTAADQYFGSIPGVEWVHPHGGLYVWMSLPPAIDTGFSSDLFGIATRDEGVMYVPGDVCYAGPLPRPRHQMRLSYGTQDAAGIDEGMRRLASAVRRVIAGA